MHVLQPQCLPLGSRCVPQASRSDHKVPIIQKIQTAPVTFSSSHCFCLSLYSKPYFSIRSIFISENFRYCRVATKLPSTSSCHDRQSIALSFFVLCIVKVALIWTLHLLRDTFIDICYIERELLHYIHSFIGCLRVIFVAHNSTN